MPLLLARVSLRPMQYLRTISELRPNVFEPWARGDNAQRPWTAKIKQSGKKARVMLVRNISFSFGPAARTTEPAGRGRRRLTVSIRPAIAAFRTRMELRAAKAQLHALDQRTLKDIGLDRSEIDSVLTDRTGERRVVWQSLLSINRPALDRQRSSPIQEEVMTIKALAVSILIFAAAAIVVVGLTSA